MRNKYADSVWYYFEDEVYENKYCLKGYDLDMDKLEEFKEWLSAGGADYVMDTLPMASETDDVELIEKETSKMVDLLIKGADIAQDKLLKGEFICW